MKRFLLTFLVTVGVAAAAYRMHRERTDLRVALEAFHPSHPAPERWRGSPGRAAVVVLRKWDAAADDEGRLACLPSLAYLARAGEPAAFARVLETLKSPSPALLRGALLAAGYAGLPGSRHSAVTSADWNALSSCVRSALDDPTPALRVAALFATHTLTGVDPEDVRDSGGRRPVEAIDMAAALAAILEGEPTFPGLEEAYPRFLARGFHRFPIQGPAAESYARSFQAALNHPRSRSEHLLETMFDPVERLPDPHAGAMIAAALDDPALAASAVQKAGLRPSPAFAPGLLRLLARPGTVRREDVVAVLITLVRRHHDGSVGPALAALLREQDLDDGLPVVLHAIHEILGPESLARHCPPDLTALPGRIAAPIAELLGRTGHAGFLDVLLDAVRRAPDVKVRTAALAGVRDLARLHRIASAAFSTRLCEIVDVPEEPGIPAAELLRHFLDLDRADLVPWIARLFEGETDPVRKAELLHLRRTGRLRRSVQEALAPILAEIAVHAESRRVREAARGSLERLEYPPEAAPFAARLALTGRGGRDEAMQDLREVGLLEPAQASARLAEHLMDLGGARVTAHLLRALAKLPPDERALRRIGPLLSSRDAYLVWRAAAILLRHHRLFDPSLAWEPIRTYLTSPLPGETYADLARETITLLRRTGQTISQVPPPLIRLLRQGSAEEVAQAADTLLLIGGREAIDIARQILADHVPARSWAQAARVVGELGERADLERLVRAVRPLADRYGPQDLAVAYDAVMGAAESMARPADAPTLAGLLDAAPPAAAATRIFRLLETLTGERYAGDHPEVRRRWQSHPWVR